MREDLAAFTPEALAALTNMGLVKRAVREMEQGQGPSVVLQDDDTLIATFPDGIKTTLPKGKSLKDSPCTCGATVVCRHRVAAVLAYAKKAQTKRKEPWEISEEELRAWFGARLGLVDAAESEGVTIDLSKDPALARFAACTVRFLAGGELQHAKCDCATPNCVHIPLAVRAFARVAKEDLDKGSAQIRLGKPAEALQVQSKPLERAERLLGRYLEHGIVDSKGLGQAREEVLSLCADCPWLCALFDAIEEQRAAWEARSALHDPSEVRRLVTEGFARIRAARKGADIAAVLGKGEPLQSPLGRTSLLSLGARLSAIGQARALEVLFWDGATVVSWTVPIPEKMDPATYIPIAQTPLSVLAAGYVTSEHLVRYARRTIQIERGRNTTITPQKGQWSDVPKPFGFESPSALLHDDLERAPLMLRPRTRTTALRVVHTPSGASDLAYSPGRQTLTGTLRDNEGALRIERAHEWFAPGALACLAETLPNARYVSGWLRDVDGERVLEPIALVTDRVVIPDLAPKARIPDLPLYEPPEQDLLSVMLSRVEAKLATLAEEGLFQARTEPLGPRLEAVGLRAFAAMDTRLGAALDAHNAGEAAKAWADLGIAVALARA